MARMEQSLEVSDLVVEVSGREILHGISLEVKSGDVVAIMGPNGSGKSTLSSAIMGRSGYTITSGTILLNGQDVTHLPTYQRAHLGLAVVGQYPGEVPGVDVYGLLEAVYDARGDAVDVTELRSTVREAAATIGFPAALLDRWVNVDLSGGEKKRFETLFLALNPPTYAILDEIDSGLDIDALRAVARGVQEISRASGMGVLAITHYSRLLKELIPSKVLVLARGMIVAEGGPEMAEELERTGYAGIGEPVAPQEPTFESIFGH